MQVILASTSRYRKQLLQRILPCFDTFDPLLEEIPRTGEVVTAMVDRLALEKASSVAAAHPRAVVIGSDQSLQVSGRILGKSGTRERAVEQLSLLSGREVVFETAVALVCQERGLRLQRRVATHVRFRLLSAAEIERYVEREMPLDCAGSFKVEGLGISLFEEVRSSDPTALIGLPLIATAELLRCAGLQLP